MSTISAELQLKTGKFAAAFTRVDAMFLRMQNRAVALYGGFKGISSAANLITGSVSAAAEQMKKIFDLGGEMSDVAANTGMAASEAMVLRQAFSNAGMGADGVQGSVARLQKALAGTNEEGQSTNAALQRLGLAAGQLDNLPAVEQIKRLQQAFAGINDPAERTRTAMELFGKSGAKMLALIGDSRALTLAGEQVGSLGALMDANAGKFDNLSDNLNTLMGLKVEQFFAGLAEQLVALDGPLEGLSKVDFTGVGSQIASAAKNMWDFTSAVDTFIAKHSGAEAMLNLLKKFGFQTWNDVFQDAQVDSLRKTNAGAETGFASRMNDPMERTSLLKDISAAADDARAKLAAVDKEWDGYGPERIGAVKNELSIHIRMLDQQAEALRALGTAAEDAAKAEVAAAAASQERWEAAKKMWEGWVKDRAKIAEAAPKFWKDEELAAAEDPSAKRKILADRIGVSDVAAIDKEIAALQKSLEQGNYSGTGGEIARIQELMPARSQIAALDRQIAADEKGKKEKDKSNSLQDIDAQVREKRSVVDRLLDAGSLPPVQVWASASRQIGLGGNAATNTDDIQRLQAERQREANGLLAQIRDLLGKRQQIAPDEIVFN